MTALAPAEARALARSALVRWAASAPVADAIPDGGAAQRAAAAPHTNPSPPECPPTASPLLRDAATRGESVPPGALVEATGRPSTDPADLAAGGSLLPAAGFRPEADVAASVERLRRRLAGRDHGRKDHRMKITSLNTFFVRPRWLFLRVTTDEGVTGWGEPGLEGRALTSAAAVEDLAEYLVGKDPLRVEDHWQVLTKGGFYRGGPLLSSAVSGIDQALWDIAGKVHGVPVHELLGGPVRDRMRVYGWIGGDKTGDYTPAQIAEEAIAQMERGHTAVKMNASSQLLAIDTPANTEQVVARLQAVREAIGDERDIAIDCHGRLSKTMARRLMPLLEPYHPLFVEEPALCEFPEAIASLAASTSIPIATGERLFSRWDYKRIVDAGVAVFQPDVSHAGGISETRRIAAMAETYDISIAPHHAIGPISLAACLQVCFSSPNALLQECGIGHTEPGLDNDGADILDYLVDRSVFDFADGSIARPTGPGLGIEIDESQLERLAVRDGRGHLPTWRHADGSFAEW